jgi:hypothetical protein
MHLQVAMQNLHIREKTLRNILKKPGLAGDNPKIS